MRISSDGTSFILPPALGAVLAYALGCELGAALLGLLAITVTLFFRDPERSSDAPPGDVLSPADGKVIAVSETDDGLFVAIFLSLLDVHVARTPAAGLLHSVRRIDGGYAAAFAEEAANNARVEMLLDTAQGPIRLSLMAGLVARRVLPWVDAPKRLRRGQRIAIIRFGSRAEMTLPPGMRATVTAGQRVRAGETVIAQAPLQPTGSTHG